MKNRVMIHRFKGFLLLSAAVMQTLACGMLFGWPVAAAVVGVQLLAAVIICCRIRAPD